ncbi:MAG: heme-binding protein [Acidobacteriia bacterium]|nr:heme-binding protein [Terriglobia bacterium]
MTRQLHSFRIAMILLLAGSCAAATADGWAQGASNLPLEKAIISSEAAANALTRDEISVDTAEKIGKACVEFARQNKMAITVSIISPSGNIVYSYRMDGQRPTNIDTALYKAQTALYNRASTHELTDRTDVEGRVTRMRMNNYYVSGGLPIIVDKVLIGAIGVGGGGMDEECANAGLTAALGPQPPLRPRQAPPAGAPGAQQRPPQR